jgi:hypothetical protein
MLMIQHRLNPLHVYCRLVEAGLNKRLCMPMCKWYQILIYSWLAWFSVIAVKICGGLDEIAN